MPLQIGILGTGHMGEGLGTAWAGAGHAVVLGSRDPSRVRCNGPATLRVGTHEEAASQRIVVLATPFRATAELCARLADRLAGKVLIDITNPFGAAPPGRSGISVHAEAVGAPARWVAAFKTNFWRTIAMVEDAPRQCLIAADDAGAREVAAGLAAAAGFEPLDCGGLAHAAALDLMVPLMIELDQRFHGESRSHWRFMTDAG